MLGVLVNNKTPQSLLGHSNVIVPKMETAEEGGLFMLRNSYY